MDTKHGAFLTPALPAGSNETSTWRGSSRRRSRVLSWSGNGGRRARLRVGARAIRREDVRRVAPDDANNRTERRRDDRAFGVSSEAPACATQQTDRRRHEWQGCRSDRFVRALRDRYGRSLPHRGDRQPRPLSATSRRSVPKSAPSERSGRSAEIFVDRRRIASHSEATSYSRAEQPVETNNPAAKAVCRRGRTILARCCSNDRIRSEVQYDYHDLPSTLGSRQRVRDQFPIISQMPEV